MDQPGNNHLLLRASQSPSPAYNGQHAAADRMRELLARTVHDHLVEERSVTSALQEIRLRLEAIDEASATGIAATVDGLAATLDGLAATLGALDSKLTARLERLDERLDDQYDRVRAMDGKLECPAGEHRRDGGAGRRGRHRRDHRAHRLPGGHRPHAGRGAAPPRARRGPVAQRQLPGIAPGARR